MTNPEAPAQPASDATTKEESGYWQPYAEFARTLRTWLVGYGVGALVLLVTQAELRARLVSSGHAAGVGLCFLGAVALQVVLAFVYKACMWQLYLGEIDEERKTAWPHKIAVAISESFLGEISVDAATLALYALGTIWAFYLVSGDGVLPTAPTVFPVGFLPPGR